MQKKADVFADILKSARQRSEYTVEELAEIIGISERSIYSFENGTIKPKFPVLQKLIQVLCIDANSIFYPEQPHKDSEIENITRMLYRCDERSLKIVKATIQAVLDTADEKQLVHT